MKAKLPTKNATRNRKAIVVNAGDDITKTLGGLEKLSEAKFTDMVLGLAKTYGWRRVHFRPAMNRRGQWSTAVQGDGVGFPDALLLKGSWLIAAELKVDKNEPTPEQTAWLDNFAKTGAFSYCWWPKHWDEIEEILRDGPTQESVP